MIIIIKAEPKIKVSFFFVNDANVFVIIDFSVSWIVISFSDDSKFSNEGNNKKVTNKDTIKPSVIIQPKSIIGLIPLKTKDKKAQIVVKIV